MTVGAQAADLTQNLPLPALIERRYIRRTALTIFFWPRFLARFFSRNYFSAIDAPTLRRSDAPTLRRWSALGGNRLLTLCPGAFSQDGRIFSTRAVRRQPGFCASRLSFPNSSPEHEGKNMPSF